MRWALQVVLLIQKTPTRDGCTDSIHDISLHIIVLHITDPLWGESIDDRWISQGESTNDWWIPLAKGSSCAFDAIFVDQSTEFKNNQVVGDLRRPCYIIVKTYVSDIYSLPLSASNLAITRSNVTRCIFVLPWHCKNCTLTAHVIMTSLPLPVSQICRTHINS